MGKFIKGIGAILCAGVIAAGVCCAGFAARGEDGKWFGNGDIKTWHWNDKADDEKPDDKPDESYGGNSANEDEGGAIISESEESGISLLSAEIPVSAYAANGIDTQADTAFLLTATVLPAETEDKSVDWSVEWVNAESEWATDKAVTDYVTVTPTADGALTANVVCKQAFGEQVRVVVTSRSNVNATAKCYCDYAKHILTSIDFCAGVFTSFSSERSVEVLSISKSSSVNSSTGKISSGGLVFLPSSSYSPAYTLDDNFDSVYVYTPSAWYVSELQKSYDFLTSKTLTFTNGVCSPSTHGLLGSREFILSGLFATTDGNNVYLNRVLSTAVGVLRNNSDKPFAELTVTHTGTYSTFSYTVQLKADPDSLAIVAQSVSLSNSNIVF